MEMKNMAYWNAKNKQTSPVKVVGMIISGLSAVAKGYSNYKQGKSDKKQAAHDALGESVSNMGNMGSSYKAPQA